MERQGLPLFQFAFFPAWPDRLAELAAMADPEDWEYENTQSEYRLPILHSYIHHTFIRLQHEDAARSDPLSPSKIAVTHDGNQACFNTGLVTPLQEEIFVLFKPHRQPERGAPWHFDSFERASSARLRGFVPLPEMAHYFDEPEDLVFDTKLDLRVNYEHYILDNRERFPPEYQGMNDYQLQQFLVGAIEQAKKRVRRNYKAAVPQYYQGRIQLLLPLCLSEPTRADLAMVVERVQPGRDDAAHYQSRTCLTLDMAYNNARLIARPDREWLRP